jgi:hypothetical protein
MSNEKELEQEILQSVKARMYPEMGCDCFDCQNRNVIHHSVGMGGPDDITGFEYEPCRKNLTWQENCSGFEKKLGIQ